MANEGTPFQNLKRSNAVEEIIDTFKEALIEGELRPGQRLPSEAELVEQLGVGRGTIREAMKMLRALGVVRIQQGDGTYIADTASSNLLNPLIFALLLEIGSGTEMVELRALIEIGSYQLAARKATPADWKRIEAAEQTYAAYAGNPERDINQLTRLDLDFHLSLIEATHNQLISRIGHTVEEMFFASIRSTLANIDDLDQIIKGHQEIVAAVRDGDRELIDRTVRKHLSFLGREVGAELL